MRILHHLEWLKLGQWLERKGADDRAILAFRAGLDELPHDEALQAALKAAHLRRGGNTDSAQNQESAQGTIISNDNQK